MTRWTKNDLAAYLVEVESWQKTPSSANPEDLKPDKGKESRLQAKIEQWCRDKGLPYFHDRSRGKNKAGWPDLTICLPKGIVLFLELKSAKGVMRPEQKHIRQQMVFLGHHHFVVKSYKGFLWVLKDHNYGN